MLCNHCGRGEVKHARKINERGYFLCAACAHYFDSFHELPEVEDRREPPPKIGEGA